MPGPFIHLAAVAALCGTTGLAAPHDEGPDIEVLDAGDPATRVRFATTPEVGDAATIELVEVVRGTLVETNTWLDEPRTDEAPDVSTQVQLAVEVISNDEDAGFVLRGDVVSYTSSAHGRGHLTSAWEVLAPYEHLVGESLYLTFGADGGLRDVDAAPGSDLDEVQRDALWDIDAPDLTSVVPDEPIGVGARWTLRAPDAFELEWQLSTLSDGRYVIDGSAVVDEADLDDFLGPPVRPADVKYSANHHLTGDPGNALDYERNDAIHLAASFTSGAEGGAMEVRVEMRTTLSPA